MNAQKERSFLRAFADAVLACGLISTAVAAVSSVLTPQIPWVARLGLMGAPLFLVGLSLAIVLPVIWKAVLGVELKEELDERGVKLLIAGPVVVFSWWFLGLLALRLLSAFSERPVAGGLLLATVGAGIVTFSTWLIVRAGDALKRYEVSGALGVGAFLACLAGAVALSVAFGSTSGTGTLFSLFGVFKRSELDLSGVGWLAGAGVLAAVFASAVVGRQSKIVVSVLGLIAFLALSNALFGASAMSFKTAVAVERHGGLAAQSLRVLQKLSDRDGDGHAAMFGGGDCNDKNPKINPAALEVFGNEADENCDGVTAAPKAEADGKGAALEDAPKVKLELPKDLNVLLLTVDTLRAELGYSNLPGIRSGISPNLDALAAQSTVYEQAYSLASYTSKSLGPMLIGLYPSETPRSFEHFDRFPKEAVFIQERLLQAGIQTVSIQGYWYFFFKGYGFERGWETLEHSAAPRVVAIEGDKTKNGDEVASNTITYLKQFADRPARFFMWTHWVDPHAEYVPHAEHDYGKSERERYDGEVSFVDAQLGRVFRALEETGLKEKTLVIVTSDHGEAFAEHGMIRHGFEVWEELVHVPLIVYVPGAEPRRVDVRRSLIDVAPSIAEVFGLTVEDGAFSGTSLLVDILAPRGAEPDARPVLVDMPQGPHNQERRAFYDGQYKLIVSAGRALGLYDLKRDPGEKNDLSEDAALLSQVRDRFDAFVAQLKPVAARK